MGVGPAKALDVSRSELEAESLEAVFTRTGL